MKQDDGVIILPLPPLLSKIENRVQYGPVNGILRCCAVSLTKIRNKKFRERSHS
jgi:hypothetical protein